MLCLFLHYTQSILFLVVHWRHTQYCATSLTQFQQEILTLSLRSLLNYNYRCQWMVLLGSLYLFLQRCSVLAHAGDVKYKNNCYWLAWRKVTFDVLRNGRSGTVLHSEPHPEKSDHCEKPPTDGAVLAKILEKSKRCFRFDIAGLWLVLRDLARDIIMEFVNWSLGFKCGLSQALQAQQWQCAFNFTLRWKSMQKDSD